MNPSKTSSAITHRNLYITTKSLVPVHQGICYCHTVQLPSSYNCCISMRFCKTTTILAVGFFFLPKIQIGSFLLFHTKQSKLTSTQLAFGQRGDRVHQHFLQNCFCEESWRWERRGPVSCCCSGSVGQRNAARTHMESSLDS